MRYVLALACCLTLAAGDLAQLRQIEEKHRMFELRAMLDQFGGNPTETLLYRAITTSRFGHEREAISQFRAFLSTKPAPEMERKARYELSSALTRLGDYGQAASELVAALRLTANGDAGRADSENVRALLQSLSGIATQTVEFGPTFRVQARRNELGSGVFLWRSTPSAASGFSIPGRISPPSPSLRPAAWDWRFATYTATPKDTRTRGIRHAWLSLANYAWDRRASTMSSSSCWPTRRSSCRR